MMSTTVVFRGLGSQHNLWLIRLLFCLLLLSACCVASNHHENDAVNDSTTIAAVERHLMIMGCQSAFWSNMKKTLEERIDFTSTVCMASEEDEQAAVDRLIQRRAEQLEIYDTTTSTTVDDSSSAAASPSMHVVATILTRNHCTDPDACRAVNPGDKYIPLLRSGVKGWFIESQPDFEALGINQTADTTIQSTELFPDNADGGRQIAVEFCRIGASIAPANIVVLYGAPEAAHSTNRIESFIDGLEEFCPQDNHHIKYRFYADWSAEKAAALLSPLFLRDGSIDAVIAANDGMALGALVSAQQMRPNKQLLVAGYDADEFVQPFLQSGKMFATVDQNPPTGVAYSLQVMLSDKATGAADFGEASSCSLARNANCTLEDYNTIQASAWGQLLEGTPNKVSTAVTIRLKDPSDAVLRERLNLYNAKVRPPQTLAEFEMALSNSTTPALVQQYYGALQDHQSSMGTGSTTTSPPTPVRTRLIDTKVYELHAESSSILAQGLLVLSWQDPRLSWSTVIYPDIPSIQLSSEEIWTPTIVLSNLLSSGFTVPMTEIQTTIFPDGTVQWELKVNTGEFRCGTIEETVFKFPFDVHNCGIDVTSYSQKDFILLATNRDFEVEVANADWFQGPTDVDTEFSPNFETVSYKVEMERDPLFVQLSLIIPSFLLNTISFAQHWIPTRTDQINLDRGGMAITTILAALALRDTMVSEVGTAFTLLDLFLLVSLVFQFVGFLITAYESSYTVCKNHSIRDGPDDSLGIGDKLGKVVTPVIFGLFNMLLSFFWGDGPWILFYLSMALCLLVVYVSRKDYLRFKRSVSESLARSFHSSKLGLGHSANGEADSSPDSIARYMRWRVLKRKTQEARDVQPESSRMAIQAKVSALTSRTGYSSQLSHTIDEEVEIDFNHTENSAAAKVQHAYRKHLAEKKQIPPTGGSTMDRDRFLSSLLFNDNTQANGGGAY